MEDAFMGIVDGTMTAKDDFKSMADDIIKELFRVLVVQKMVGMISGAITGAFTGGGATPNPHTRASGGPVSAGQAYVTGEHGRELFVPKTDGRILSGAQTSNAARSGGDGVTIIQNNTFGNGVNRAEVNAMLPKLVQASKAAVLDAKLRGGSYGGAFS
jgi:lambda family phage tail tape measure protein